MLKLKYTEDYLSAPRTNVPQDNQLEPFHGEALVRTGWLVRLRARLQSALIKFALDLVRTFWPNLRIGRVLIVTRARHVQEVLNSSDVFRVPYGPEMRELAGGGDFVLGLDGAAHCKQRAVIESILKREDLPVLIAQTGFIARNLLDASGGRIDVMHDFVTRIATETCLSYFGLEARDHDGFAAWSLAISSLLFADPFGDPQTRSLALSAAANLRAVIDRAIMKARQGRAHPGTLLERLLAMQASGAAGNCSPALDDKTIRAILVGLVTGFIPTTSLGAANMFLELLRRPRWMSEAQALAVSGDRAGLKALLHEAGRFNPALLPGQWRFCVRDTEIAKGSWWRRKVKAGTVIMASTASALQDPQAFPQPWFFDPVRKRAPDLMFGWLPHSCVGAQIAMEQITEIMMALLSQPGLERAKGGKLEFFGPFPSRLDMRFVPATTPKSQSMVTVTAKVTEKVRLKDLQEEIAKLGNPAHPDIAQTLHDTGIVHFASLSAVDGAAEGEPEPHLILELNVDGGTEDAIRILAEKCSDWLTPIFAYANPSNTTLAELLLANTHTLHQLPWGTTGLNFNGTPEFAVRTIEREAALAAFARKALDSYLEQNIGIGNRAMLALDYVRRVIRQDQTLPGFESIRPLADEARESDFESLLYVPSRKQLKLAAWVAPSSTLQQVWTLCTKPEVRRLIWIWLALDFIGATAVFLTLSGSWAARLPLAPVGSTICLLFLTVLLVGAFLWQLRRQESEDVSEERQPDLDHMRAVTATENYPGYAQNHIVAVPPLKPGWFRRLTLALAMWGILRTLSVRFRPGFVVDMGTIHYARWFRLPGTDKLIFLSNYDGSWESYLEDFIMKAHPGQTAAWSNCVGFPRTRYLILDGAQDGDRFKRWVRGQQEVSPFWYSGYPSLTTDQIRNNALVRQGLAQATTDTAARAWIRCFGTMQRPDNVLEADDIQSLVFRGMREFHYSACLALNLSDKGARSWLSGIMPGQPGSTQNSRQHVTFGDHSFADPSRESANFVAFSARGLQRLGVNTTAKDDGLATFPAPFKMGMGNRKRILGDVNGSSPDDWLWTDAAPKGADKARESDGVLFIYARTPEMLRKLVAAHTDWLRENGCDAVFAIKTGPSGGGLDFEHFGFRDGISQPVIRGTQRFAKGALARDIVAPGEFIFGYSNNEGYVAPSFTVRAASDMDDALPIPDPPAASDFPNFSARKPTSGLRDIGRNGSFVVVRQIEQFVDAFKAYTKEEAARVGKTYKNLENVTSSTISSEWIAAKMMGRWRDGTPLVDRTIPLPQRQPHTITGAQAHLPPPAACPMAGRRQETPNSDTLYDDERLPDNDFAYGVDDPLGLQCPLGAHIRRTNPRDGLKLGDPLQQSIVNRHRLLRRGRSYEVTPADSAAPEKGLLFICLCADLERQFEFVQQTWVGARSFEGLIDEADPILAQDDFGGKRAFTIPTPSGPVKLKNLKAFTRVRGGGYFFLPSRSALQYLVQLRYAEAIGHEARPCRGMRIPDRYRSQSKV